MKKLHKIIFEALHNTPLGRGTEATTYPADQFVVRVPHKIKITNKLKSDIANNIGKITKSNTKWHRHNFGQTIYTYIYPDDKTTHITINKRAFGFPTNDLLPDVPTARQITRAIPRAISKMRIIASAPTASYNKLITDLNYINTTDYTIDPCEYNLLYSPEHKRFYIIDLRPVKKTRSIGDLILMLLTDIPNMPPHPEYYKYEEQIISKLLKSAQHLGLTHPSAYKIKPRTLEVIQSPTAQQMYKNFCKI